MTKVKNNNNDIKKLRLFSKREKSSGRRSKITGYSSTEPVYRWTNEKMRSYPNNNLKGKDVLTITSSGDHALDAVLCGATKIDSIDINIFSKYYSALKIAIIKTNNYDDFFNKIDFFVQNISADKKSRFNILDDVSKFLTNEQIEFWVNYIHLGIEEDDFFYNPLGPWKNKYYSKDVYFKLKDRLDDVKITYYDNDILNINNVLDGKTYDCIYLSNILERVILGTGTTKGRKELIEKVSKHLNNGGILYNYALGMGRISLDKIFGEYYEDMLKDFNFKYHCNYADETTCEHGIIQMKIK